MAESSMQEAARDVQAVQTVKNLDDLNYLSLLTGDCQLPTEKMELRGKKVMVLGLARTGGETARFLARQGAEVLVSDCRSEAELQRERETLCELPFASFWAAKKPPGWKGWISWFPALAFLQRTLC